MSATPVSPAVAGDFELSANQVLTITAGQRSSTGTATITAENNEVDAPAKELTVSAALTAGTLGLGRAGVAPLTITDDETPAGRDAGAGSGVDLGERRREHGDREP